jgi:purine-binding chemotaxis protein CheW
LTNADAMSVVLVRIGSQAFAIDIKSVHEIRAWSEPTPLPWAPAHVPGMMDLRGLVIPVVDLAARLGLPPIQAGPTSVIVVAEVRGRLAGLLVDVVCDLVDLEASRLQATPDIGSADSSDVVQGIFELDGRIVSLIALGEIIPATLAEPARLAS